MLMTENFNESDGYKGVYVYACYFGFDKSRGQGGNKQGFNFIVPWVFMGKRSNA